MPAAQQRRMRRNLAACFILTACALSGCALFTDKGDKTPAPPPEAAVAPPHRTPPANATPRPARKPTPPGEPDEATAQREAAAIDPDRVIGMNEADTQQWLGEPTERKDAPPATIWRYASRDCEVEIYFYLDLQQRIMRALHYEVRGTDSGEQRPERCFQQLVSEHREHDDGAVADPPR
jgi:hypothetical protein